MEIKIIGNILHNNPDPNKYPCYKVGMLARNFGFGGIKEQKKRFMNDVIEVTNNKVDLKRYLM